MCLLFVSVLQPNRVADNNKPGQQQAGKLCSTERKLQDEIPPPVLAVGYTHASTHSNAHKNTQVHHNSGIDDTTQRLLAYLSLTQMINIAAAAEGVGAQEKVS